MWLNCGEEGNVNAYCVSEMTKGLVWTGREGRMIPKGEVGGVVIGRLSAGFYSLV